MPEILSEAISSLKEYFEFTKAPEELAALLQSLGGCNERVLHKGYARYLNTDSFIDKLLGVYVVTSARFVFVAKKKPLPFVKITERLVLPLRSLEKVESAKYRLGRALKFMVGAKDYIFLLTNLHTFASKEQIDDVAHAINQARLVVA